MAEPYYRKPSIEELVPSDLDKIFEDAGLTMEYLANRLKEETEARVSKHVKIKGNVANTLDPNVRILAKASTGLNLEAFGVVPDPLAGDEPIDVAETLLVVDEVAHDIRLRATTEALKIKGAYVNKGENNTDIVNINLIDFKDSDFDAPESKPAE